MAATMSEESLLDAALDAPLFKSRLSYSTISNTQPQTVQPKRSKKCKVLCGGIIFITLLVLIAVIVVVVKILTEPHEDVDWQAHWYSRRTVLIWRNNFQAGKENDFNKPRNINSDELYRKWNCTDSNCDFIFSKYGSWLDPNYYDPDDYDAVIFDMDHLNASNLKNTFPHKSSKTYFIFAANNPTAGRHRNLRQEKYYYNLTMSYKLDSDIIWQSWHFQYKWSKEYASPQRSPNWITADMRTPTTSFVTYLESSKTALSVAVAPCGNVSKHSNLIDELKQYMDVEVHSDCDYPKYNSRNQQSDICTGSFDRKYKFFFAFEEELCEDYVTENFYKALKCNIVPVVLGGADYRNFAPAHSYIDATSFNSLRELADELYNLERYLQEYAKYFWWTKYYELKAVTPFCDICAKVMSLIDRNNVREPSYWHAVDSWWKDSNCSAKSVFELV